MIENNGRCGGGGGGGGGGSLLNIGNKSVTQTKASMIIQPQGEVSSCKT